ncbi:MAG: UDP-N-acetylmuramoyl-tripeptide--D-alanyl-D-alanine ligase [Chitinophagaceae bacterium]|nr:UDP-N-acetylmuramoyl-tripeptide--D-alanyl-D-alanine ligase [Chitinophagaceae bacterium]
MRIEDLYQLYLEHPAVQIDTRKLIAGDLFFALKGPHFNGNGFALQALDNGAAYAIVDEFEGPPHDRIIKVPDVLLTLQELALHHRLQFNIPVIAITGSNGKTTTKELAHEVLSRQFKTYTTQGNLNNHIGVPLTLLKIKPDAQVALIEMGANHQLEIRGYCRYALPTHGLITNCGKAHLEGFGGVEGIRKGKGELFDHLRENNGTAFIMGDYTYLKEMSAGIPHIITYGTKDADYTGKVKDSKLFLEVDMLTGTNIGTIKTNLVGEYNLPNVLSAVALGKYFQVPDELIKAAIEGFSPTNSRSQLITRGSNQFILDAYNANPTSMKAAIENFSRMEGKDKILMLGGMMELGTESISEHQALVDLIKTHPWKQVVLVGGDFSQVDHPYIYFRNSDDASAWFRQQQFGNSHFLIKGSRSMQMEKVLE